MINPKDLYCYATTQPIGTVGQSIIQYEIHRYSDIRGLSTRLAYVIICTHRIVIPNATPYVVGANSAAFTSYTDYPAVVTNTITASTAPNGTPSNVLLRELFPRTLNANISTSLDTQAGSSNTSTNQQTTGSSTSQSNTFGVSLSGGFFGELPVGSLTVDYQHSWGSGAYQSNSSGTGTGYQASSSSGETMSIKDWSSYGQADSSGQTPTWIWGQSYPWDVILYNQSQDGTNIDLPPFIQSRLMATLTGGSSSAPTYTTFALPPSQLSLFGIDFTMKASWLIEFPDGVTAPETISLSHDLNYYTASHTLSGSAPAVSISAQISPPSPATYQSPALDLSTYALDPIPSVRNGAAINFTTAGLFTYPPNAQGSAFKIISSANTLQVTGSGFAPDMSSDFTLGATQLTVTFKILDTDEEYSLLLHHWVGAAGNAVNVSVAVNTAPAIGIPVDALEGQGGQGNISKIKLRNLNFSSVDFHDYLQLGLNTIQITVTPVNASAANQYILSAMAISKDD